MSRMAACPERIGRYQIVERVGRGGMGVLYRGFDAVLERDVAIKLMLADFSEDPEQLRPRFYREARAVARLQHRNIVTIFEFAEEDNTPYIVMEFLRGTSLAERMTTTPALTIDRKVDVVAQLCAGLQYAHEQGVVHRDVKPANVFLQHDGTVKLLDFGIAKVATSTLTQQGDMLGSASYMSPEQVSGSESVDCRADIFSTGVVLYELLAGRKPFEGAGPTAIIMKILHDDPSPIGNVVMNLPERLVSAVHRALAKDPADRFGTAGEMGRELEAIRQMLAVSESAGAPQLDETVLASASWPGSAARPESAGVTTAGLSLARRWLLPGGIAAAVVTLAVVVALAFGRGGARSPEGAPTTSGGRLEPAGGTTSTPAAPRLPRSDVKSSDSPPIPPAAPAERMILIKSDPSGATIELDGRIVGQTPQAITVNGTGRHRVRLSKRGFRPLDIPSHALGKASLTYQLRADEPAPAAADSAAASKAADKPDDARKSEVEAQPAGPATVAAVRGQEGCDVRIDGKSHGSPPLSNVSLPAGDHSFTLHCAGQAPIERRVSLRPGMNAPVVFTRR